MGIHMKQLVIQMISNPTTSLSDLPADVEDKNRFANVIPNPESRVPITTPSGQQAYINANFIKVKTSHPEIVTMGQQ